MSKTTGIDRFEPDHYPGTQGMKKVEGGSWVMYGDHVAYLSRQSVNEGDWEKEFNFLTERERPTMTTRDRKTVTVEVISGVEGPCLALDDTRIAGPKPWGGGRVVHSFKVDIFHMLRALPKDIINDDQ